MVTNHVWRGWVSHRLSNKRCSKNARSLIRLDTLCADKVKWPLAGLDRRVAWLRVTLLSASFLGLIACAPAWANSRRFPLSPVAEWIPILPSPADRILFGAMLASLLVALWLYRPGVTFFLGSCFFGFCEDQNRGQPWLYMYVVMLALSLASANRAIAACRIAISVVYFWSGVQKLNPGFFEVIPKWFVDPAANKWHWPGPVVHVLKLAVESAPFVEIGIGVLLWVRPTRKAALISVLILHSVSLIVLGPLGYNYNWVVWPWNVAMMALVFGLFSKSRFFDAAEPGPAAGFLPAKAVAEVRAGPPKGRGKTRRTSGSEPRPKGEPKSNNSIRAVTLREVRTSKPVIVVLALFSLLPVLSYCGWWDSYFSFSLYAQNAARANLFITQSCADHLPAELRKYVQPFNSNYDPQHQGPLMLGFDPWCYEELHVPPVPEVRNFKAIFSSLRKYAQRPEDLRMVIGPRAGPVIFLEGDRVELLQRK